MATKPYGYYAEIADRFTVDVCDADQVLCDTCHFQIHGEVVEVNYRNNRTSGLHKVEWLCKACAIGLEMEEDHA